MADIHQPHDRLFRAVFSDPKEAAGLLQATLPPDVRDSFDWTTLALRSGTFIDEELRASQSDLLFQVDQTASGQPVSMYVLLEHQSSPDRWIRLRLLRYLCRIWEAELRDDPERRQLRPVVPVVFYQGERRWTHSTEFADLFPEVARGLPWIPRFNHELLDQTTLDPAAVGGEVKGRITQLLLMAPVSQDPEAVLDWAAHWTLALSEVGGGIDERRRFIEYLAAIQDGALINQFEEASGRHGLNLEEDIMSYAEQLLAEGRAEGEARGRIQERIQIVQGFVETGTSWDVIEAATGLTEADFQELKARVAKPDSPPTGC